MDGQQTRDRKPMNTIGWILVAVAAIGVIASVAGIIHSLAHPSPSLADSATELYLHDTYYVISHPSSVWPLLLCGVLSVAIGIVGYMHTNQYARHMMGPLPDLPPPSSPADER